MSRLLCLRNVALAASVSRVGCFYWLIRSICSTPSLGSHSFFKGEACLRERNASQQSVLFLKYCLHPLSCVGPTSLLAQSSNQQPAKDYKSVLTEEIHATIL